MTKKEILTKLIKKYTLVLREIKNVRTYGKVYKILRDNNCHIGICRAAEYNFNTWLYSKVWVKKEKNEYGMYWYNCPYQVDTKKETIECLEYRINKMKEILKRCQ